MILRMKHVRAAGMCSRGARGFCEEMGFDWLDFVENGIDTEKLKGIDNAMLDSVLAIAAQDQEGTEVV